MARRKKFQHEVNGILLLDKDLGVSSNKALQDARFLCRANKAGHTGSLDPLASGLLPICFGEATKISGLMLQQDKKYLVDVRLGVQTDTGDAEGKVIAQHPVPELPEQKLLHCLNHFTGEINQVPPMYSALKHQGKKLYELARAGQVIERDPRQVSIFELQCLSFKNDILSLQVHCSKGTYIRSLAEDIGNYLGCGATVTKLRRIAVGHFQLANAYTLQVLQSHLEQNALSDLLLPVDFPLLQWPEVQLQTQEAALLRQGGQITLPEMHEQGKVRMYSDNYFIGIGEILSGGRLQPKRIFNL